MRIFLLALLTALNPCPRAGAVSRKGPDVSRSARPAGDDVLREDRPLEPADGLLDLSLDAAVPALAASGEIALPAAPAEAALQSIDPAVAQSLREAREGKDSQKSVAPSAKFSQWLGEGWKTGSFESDGARVHYAFVEGTGDLHPILAFHGRALGMAGFQELARAAKEEFAGHPIVLLERPGYTLGTSGKDVEFDRIHPSNAAAISKGIDLARLLGKGRKVAIITHSLGAMLLPELDPRKVLGIGLIDPGVYGMLHSAGVEAVMDQIAGLPSMLRGGWVQSSADVMIRDLKSRIHRTEDLSADFKASLNAWLREAAQSSSYGRLLFEETRWALRGRQETPYRPWGDKVPVFVGQHDKDEIVTQGSVEKLAGSLRRAGRPLRVESQPGTHLTFLGNPRPMLRALKSFLSELL